MAEKFEYTREWTDANAFPMLGFSKSWKNPEDYPTIELDEDKVREDMQSLHDEVKNYINTKLIPAVLAEDATEEARAAAEEARSNAEAERQSAEEARSDAETIRQSNEETRQSNEETRQNNEADRVAAENARANAETAREQAESGRIAAEKGRVTAEQEREDKETSRQTAELWRLEAEAERVAAEEDRASAEAERVAAEQARASAEAERVAAEQARADENAGIVAQATEKAVEAASSAASAASSAADAESSAEQASASESAAADSKKTAGAAADSACADRLEAQYIARVIQHGQLPTDLPTNLILEAGKAVTYSATDTEPYTVPTVAKSLELGRRYQVLISGTVYAEFLWTGKTVYVRKESDEPGTYLVSVSGEMSYDQTTYKLTLQNGTMGFAPNSGRSVTVTLKAVDDSALPPSHVVPVSDLKSILTNIVTFLKSVPFDDTVASASDLDAIQSKIDALGFGGGSEEPTETVSATFSDGVLAISGATVNSATFTGGVLAIG